MENFIFCAVQSNFEQLLNEDNSVPIHHKNVQALAIEMQKIADCTAPKIIKEVLNYVKRAITIFDTLHNLPFLALIQCIIVQNLHLFWAKHFRNSDAFRH